MFNFLWFPTLCWYVIQFLGESCFVFLICPNLYDGHWTKGEQCWTIGSHHREQSPFVPASFWYTTIDPGFYSINWSRSLPGVKYIKYVSLMCKNKIGFINGSCVKEALDPNLHHVWDICNALVFAWIMNSVTRESLRSMVCSTSAFLVWKDFKERFSQFDGSTIYQLHREICVMQHNLDSISTYYGRLKLL